MEIERAKEIITMLANGVDPKTGEAFPQDSPYNDPDIIRALFVILGSVRTTRRLQKMTVEEKQKENLDNGRPRNAGLPWSSGLKKEVVLMFNEGKTLDELSRHFERTRSAVRSELKHQGLMEEN